jgi:hypothetical protein
MLDIDFREHWKTILLVVAGIALLACIIALIIGLSSNARRRTAEQEAQAAEAAALVPMSIIDELELRPEKLMISPGLEEFWRGDYQPRHPSRRQWGMEDLRRYLYDPRQIGGESLRRVNRELIEELLEEYR